MAVYSPILDRTLVLDLARKLVETGAGEDLVQTTTQAGALVVTTPGVH